MIDSELIYCYDFYVKIINKLTATIIFVALAIIISLVLIFYLNNRENDKRDSQLTIINQTNEIIEKHTGQETPKSISSIINQLSDNKLSEEKKYLALIKVKDYLSYVYNDSLSPEVREFIQEDLDKYGEKNFPNSYKSSHFIIVCADPTCGESIDPEMEKVIKEINALKMPDINRDTIKYNLNLALYLTSKDMGEKQSGFKLVIRQLNDLGNTEASRTAEKIKAYFEKRYNSEL